MERRNFVKYTTGIVGIIFSGPIFAKNVIIPRVPQEFSMDQLDIALRDHFNNIFLGVNFDINQNSSAGKIELADSYEIILNKDKNNIFEIADIIIERTKELGFDSSELLEKRIPEGLTISTGAISFKNENEQMYFLKIPELKSYDARITYTNPVIIKYDKPLSISLQEDKFEKLISNENSDYYKGKSTGVKVYKFKKEISYNLKISQLNPLKFSNTEYETPNQQVISKDQVLEYLSENFKTIVL